LVIKSPQEFLGVGPRGKIEFISEVEKLRYSLKMDINYNPESAVGSYCQRNFRMYLQGFMNKWIKKIQNGT